MMKTRTLGADLTVSSLGLGCMGFSHAYGAPTEKNEAIRSIRAACDLGYTLFDTAETYGTATDPHDNEKLVGEALKDIRSNVQIVTKFGIRFDETSREVNAPDPGRPPGDHPGLGGGLPPAAGHRPHRPVLPAPHGPKRGAGDRGPGDG